MSVKSENVLQRVTGWEAVELVFQCVFIGLLQFIKLGIRRLWKGACRRKEPSTPSVELTVDSSIGIHCHIKVLGVKYHYVETGPKDGNIALILGDAPDSGNLWVPSWSSVIRRLAENHYHVITLDLRGTGGSEGGNRRDLSPPRAVAEITALLKALGVTENKQAIVIGFGIGGVLTWYLSHSKGSLIRKMAVVGAPHPNLYWQYPPASFCTNLHFIQWPHFPEKWLADGVMQEGTQWTGSRARDWSGALNYVRGAAWWRIHPGHKVRPRALLIGARTGAAQLVASAQMCASPALRLVADPSPRDPELPGLILDFFVGKPKQAEEVPRGIMGRVLGVMADKSRGLTRLALTPSD
ncbi:epoxide hydrolase 4-like [Aricia agestis]|uniref:epoxide hydrolase 4-like n=1 Tax=Aricia agestis TaxID=91739 RepID=UPI001C2045D3|nr:epoxide hydrolase 4-like [Aricia agestis]